jgi:glycosyltransferase involved in cell wall biosynthesis
MKPYVLVSGDFVKTGGMDRANYALASYLARQGRDVHLVGFRAAEDLLTLPRIRFHRVPKVAKSYLLSGPLLDRAGRFWAAKIAALGGRVVVNGGNCRWHDVNWVHHVHAAGRPWMQGGALRRAKIRLSHRLALAGERAVVPRARIVLTTCRRTKDDIVSCLGVRADRVVPVYMGVDSELFRPVDARERRQIRAKLGWSAERPVVMFVGALGDERKGFDTLYRAWMALCSEPGWDAHLVVVGGGAGAAMWKDRARRERLSERIEFLGFVKNLPEVLAAGDAHVLPSRYEGYSLSTQEALACGLPAFVSVAAGIAERYPHELAPLLIPDPDDAADLARRLARWRREMARYRADVVGLSEQLRRHSWDDMAEQMMAVIEGAVPELAAP